MQSAQERTLAFEFRPDALIPIALLLVFTTLRFGVANALLATSLFFASLFAHEAGHMLAAAFFYTRVSAFGFCLKGAYVRRRKGEGLKELFISAAGPAVNIAIAAMLWRATGIGAWLAQMNAALAFMNLLPFQGSDGQRMLATLRELLFPQPSTVPTA